MCLLFLGAEAIVNNPNRPSEIPVLPISRALPFRMMLVRLAYILISLTLHRALIVYLFINSRLSGYCTSLIGPIEELCPPECCLCIAIAGMLLRLSPPKTLFA